MNDEKSDFIEMDDDHDKTDTASIISASNSPQNDVEFNKEETNTTFFTDPSFSLKIKPDEKKSSENSKSFHSDNASIISKSSDSDSNKLDVASNGSFSSSENKSKSQSENNNESNSSSSFYKSDSPSATSKSSTRSSFKSSSKSGIKSSSNIEESKTDSTSINSGHSDRSNKLPQKKLSDSNFSHEADLSSNSKNSINRSNINSKDNSSINDQAILDAFKILMEKNKLPPPELQPKVLQYLKSESLKALVDENYPLASKLDQATNSIVKDTYKRRKDNRRTNKDRKVDHKARKAQHLLNREEKHRKAMLDEYLSNEDIQYKEMKKRHKLEIDNFKAQWENPETLIPFNKSSNKLLNLRKSQKALALSKRFKEAEIVKKEADALQQKELNEAHQKAKNVFEQTFQNLKEQQQKEIECFEEHKKRFCSFLENERIRATMPYRNMLQFYQRQQDERKLPNGRPAPKIKSVNKPRSDALLEVLPPSSPTVSHGVIKYRMAPEAKSLGLNGLELVKGDKPK